MANPVHNPFAGIPSLERFQGWLQQLPHPIFIRSGLGQVGQDDIGQHVITGDNIAFATITAVNIAFATILGTNIANATILGTNIGAATIAGSNIALATITGSNIASATVTGSNIANATITSTQIANATITGGNIANATITGGNIANATITGSNLVNATITATQIANATITGTQIASATITGGNIASGTIVGGNIASNTITGGNIAATTITAGNITNLTITAAQIANLTITSSKVNTSLMSYNHNIVFSVASSTQVNWASGTITTSDGTSYSIVSGNTGTMSAKTFIYLDTAASVTVLQTTTTLATAVGDGKMLIAVAQNNTGEAIFQVFNGIGGLNLAGSSIVAASITSNEIATATITAGNMVVGTITAASGIIADINADTITSGSIRAINVNASSHTTLGSYLTSSASGGATTLNVKNTTDFATSGSGVIIDTTNDRDAISWTGKTSTTLTGCTGVLAHNSGATIVPLSKVMLIDAATNEMRFYGDRGDSTIDEIGSIGIVTVGSDNIIAKFGTTTGSGGLVGVQGLSVNGIGVVGVGVNTYGVEGRSAFTGVHGLSTGGDSGGRFEGNATSGNLFLPNCNSSTFPTSPSAARLAQVGNRLYYGTASGWFPLTQPYFESSEQTLTNGTKVTVAHGITDGAGAGIVPKKYFIVLRCKTAQLNYSVGDEVTCSPQDFDGTNATGLQGHADTTNVGFTVGTSGVRLLDKNTGGTAGITLANWKAVIRCY
jgi:uncharacterized protein YjbI with pentapeptide repeats